MASQASFSLLVLALLVAGVSAGGGGPIDYDYKTDPKTWGNKYKECSNGKTQSPIDINKNVTVTSKTLQPLIRTYHAANACLVDNGATIGVRYDSEHAGMSIDGKNYSMKLMHWHSPSEHTIDGVQYPLELHLVHEAEDHSHAVIGLLYEYGQPDPFITSLTPSLKKLAKMAKSGHLEDVSLGELDVKLLGEKTGKYWRYVGSLTTPPCSEPVIWTVVPKLRTVTKEQVEALRSPLAKDYKKNCRPVQPLNDRKVEMYDGPDT